MDNRKGFGDDGRPVDFEFIVVGSGAGGATVAEALARKGRSVLVMERGQPEQRLGTAGAITRSHVHCLALDPRGRHVATAWARP